MTHEAGDTLIHQAMALWESVLAIKDRHPTVAAAFEQHGPGGVRALVAGLVPALAEAYNYATRRGYDSPFDWEFCPAFVAHCVQWDCEVEVREDWKRRVADHILPDAF